MDLLSTRLATFPDCAELGSNGVACTRALIDFTIPHVAPLLIRKPLMQVSLRSLEKKSTSKPKPCEAEANPIPPPPAVLRSSWSLAGTRTYHKPFQSVDYKGFTLVEAGGVELFMSIENGKLLKIRDAQHA
jgi:hypothetical protein